MSKLKALYGVHVIFKRTNRFFCFCFGQNPMQTRWETRDEMTCSIRSWMSVCSHGLIHAIAHSLRWIRKMLCMKYDRKAKRFSSRSSFLLYLFYFWMCNRFKKNPNHKTRVYTQFDSIVMLMLMCIRSRVRDRFTESFEVSTKMRPDALNVGVECLYLNIKFLDWMRRERKTTEKSMDLINCTLMITSIH